MMEAWDVVVIGGGHAALRSAIAAKQSGASTLLISTQGVGNGGCGDATGLAASLAESTSKGHRDDTIRCGDYLCDQDIVSSRTGGAIHLVAEMEQWGVNFRRDSEGLPLTRTLPGHGMPRVVGCGDSTDFEMHGALEEQCIKNGISRRGDTHIIEFVHSDERILGLVALDLNLGEVIPIQSKAVIVADEGFHGAWSGDADGGWGMYLAMKAGVSLRNLEFQSWTPLAIPDSEVTLSLGLLGEGAVLQGPSSADGGPTSMAAQMADAGAGWALDISELKADAPTWFAESCGIVEERLGLDPSSEPIPVEPRVDATIGGIPIDIEGKVILGTQGNTFTGLFAAGDASSSGLHGAGITSGNRLLDALAGGMTAGKNAAIHASDCGFTGAEQILERLDAASGALHAELDASSEGAPRAGELLGKLTSIMNANMGLNRNGGDLNNAATALNNLSRDAATMRIDHTGGLLMNTNLVNNMCLQASIALATAAVNAASQRNESRGTHRRTDYNERDDEGFLKHSMVDSEGNVEWSPLRRSATGSWILAPGQ